MPRDDHYQDITVEGNVSLGAQSTVEGNLVPDEDDNRDLGASTDRWRKLWVTDIDATNPPTLGAQTANQVFAGPSSGAAAVPAFRALVLEDLPEGTANQVLGTNAGATAIEHKTLSAGTTGTDFAIAHAANTVTFNLPDASATARGAVTTGAQSFTGDKTFGGSGAQELRLDSSGSDSTLIVDSAGANNAKISLRRSDVEQGTLFTNGASGEVGFNYNNALPFVITPLDSGATYLKVLRESTGIMKVFGGRSGATGTGNHLVVQGGETNDYQAGNLILRGGRATGTGTDGDILVQSADGVTEYLRILDASGNVSVAGDIFPDATGNDLGTTSARWDAFLDVATAGHLNNVYHLDGNKYAQTAAGLQAAINAAVTAGSGTVVIPPQVTIALGSTSISIDANDITIQGAGTGRTALTYSGTGDAIQISSTTLRQRITLSGFSLTQAGTAQTGNGIRVQNSRRVIVEDVWISSFNNGIYLDSTTAAGGIIDFNLDNFRMSSNLIGVKMEKGAGGAINAIRLNRGHINGAGSAVAGGYALWQDNGAGQGNWFDGIHIDAVETIMRVGGEKQFYNIRVDNDITNNIEFAGASADSNFIVGAFGGGLTQPYAQAPPAGAVNNKILANGILEVLSDGSESNNTTIFRNGITQKLSHFYNSTTDKLVWRKVGVEDTLHLDHTANQVQITRTSNGVLVSPLLLSNPGIGDSTAIGINFTAGTTSVVAAIKAEKPTGSGSARGALVFSTRDASFAEAGRFNEKGFFEAKRLKAKGTALVAGDFALSAGWGNTASVGSIRGVDQWHEFVVTSAGTGQGASPTITLTYKDLTWTTAPIVLCNRQEFANQPTVTFTVTTQSATTYVLTFDGTPVASETYRIACFVGGI